MLKAAASLIRGRIARDAVLPQRDVSSATIAPLTGFVNLRASLD